MQGYRRGAKLEEINQIKQMTLEGKSVDEISRAIRVVPECVRSFVEKFQLKAKPQPVEAVKDESVKMKRQRVAKALPTQAPIPAAPSLPSV